MAENFLNDRLGVLAERYDEGLAGGNYFYESHITDQSPATVHVDEHQMIMLSSYSYLGMLGHPELNAAAVAAIGRYGTGTHAVRLLGGTTSLHRTLESRLASFTGAEATVVFSSGYVANLATIATVVGRHSVVIGDKLDHASIVDACRLSGARFVRFDHDDIADLERCLGQVAGSPTLVVVDAVYSMDGDIVDLPATARLCRQHGAALMVDEAHSLGVLGRTGRGVVEHFGLDESAVDIRTGSLSKAIPASGGYAAGSSRLVDALRHNARPYIFSGALPPASAAAATAALDLLDREPERVGTLHNRAQQLRESLRAAGFNTLNSQSPIVPLVCGSEQQAFDMTRYCRQAGVYVTPVIFPAVEKALPRLRLVVTAGLSDAEIKEGGDVLIAAGRFHGVIG